MNKKLQVFVSSTYTDLIEERQAAVQAILDAGHIPAGMELFKAGKSQMKTIRKWIDESDVYLLILGGRYGSIEEESGLSYTELEYQYALSKNMPVFAIVLSDDFLQKKTSTADSDIIFEKDNSDKYESFKAYVKTKIVKFVSNLDQVSISILSHLNYIMNDSDYDLIGWSKNATTQNVITHNNAFNANETYTLPIKDQYTVFVIMPFTEEWAEDVYFLLQEACSSDNNVRLNRADKILGSHFTYNNIITSIKSSDLIIADVTTKDANVFYELGFAHALKKNVILIHQSDADVPLDIAHDIMHIKLTYTLTVSKIREFHSKLKKIINFYINNSI